MNPPPRLRADILALPGLFYVGRCTQWYGPYPMQQIQAGIDSGNIIPTDTIQIDGANHLVSTLLVKPPPLPPLVSLDAMNSDPAGSPESPVLLPKRERPLWWLINLVSIGLTILWIYFLLKPIVSNYTDTGVIPGQRMWFWQYREFHYAGDKIDWWANGLSFFWSWLSAMALFVLACRPKLLRKIAAVVVFIFLIIAIEMVRAIVKSYMRGH